MLLLAKVSLEGELLFEDIEQPLLLLQLA